MSARGRDDAGEASASSAQSLALTPLPTRQAEEAPDRDPPEAERSPEEFVSAKYPWRRGGARRVTQFRIVGIPLPLLCPQVHTALRTRSAVLLRLAIARVGAARAHPVDHHIASGAAESLSGRGDSLIAEQTQASDGLHWGMRSAATRRVRGASFPNEKGPPIGGPFL